MFTMKKPINLSTYFIAAYILISLVFILFTLWNDFKINVIQNSFNSGYAASVRQIMNEASKPECKPFTVFESEKRTELINIACLKQAISQTQVQNPEAPKETEKE